MANLIKIKNNSVYGKEMENVRNRVNIELVNNNEQRLLKVLSHPSYKRTTIFNENLVAVHKHKKEVKLDKPIINGMIILDLSKMLMYDFYYNVLKNRYGDKVKLLFTDTDSLCVEIETEDVYKDMSEQKQHYDFSEYPIDHFLYNTNNQAVVGKFKDEYASKIITEFIGLRSKLYAIKEEKDTLQLIITDKLIRNNDLIYNTMIKPAFEKFKLKHKLISCNANELKLNISISFGCIRTEINKSIQNLAESLNIEFMFQLNISIELLDCECLSEKKICKGVKKCVIDKKLKFNDYKEVLFNQEQKRHDMNLIKSSKHQLNTVKINKISLSCYDNKRYLLDDSITSYSYGHYKIPKEII